MKAVHTFLVVIVISCVAALPLAGTSSAQNSESGILIRPSFVEYYPENFGLSVDLSGNRAIVGAHGWWSRSTSGYRHEDGAAYIFGRQGEGWDLEATFVQNDKKWGYGLFVAISGDFAIVAGDYTEIPTTIYHKVFDEWQEEATLPGVDIFGSIDIHEDSTGVYAIIGLLSYEEERFKTGAIHIYKRNGSIWNETTVIFPSDGTPGDYFGSSSSMDGDYLIVGSRSKIQGTFRGGAYIYKRDSPDWSQWTEVAVLSASDGQNYDYFGHSVDISNGYAVVGNNGYHRNNRPDEIGSAYVFRETDNGWEEDQILVPDDGVSGTEFGKAVSIYSGTYVMVTIGAPRYSFDLSEGSNAYVFTRDDLNSTWLSPGKLRATDGPVAPMFGAAVSMSFSDILVGAPDNDNGAAYVYQYAVAAPHHIAFRSSDYVGPIYAQTESSFYFEARGEDDVLLEDFHSGINYRVVDASNNTLSSDQLPDLSFWDGKWDDIMSFWPSQDEVTIQFSFNGIALGESPVFDVLPAWNIEFDMPAGPIPFDTDVEIAATIKNYHTDEIFTGDGDIMFTAELPYTGGSSMGSFDPSDGVVALEGGSTSIVYHTPTSGEMGNNQTIRITGSFEDPTGKQWEWFGELNFQSGGGATGGSTEVTRLNSMSGGGSENDAVGAVAASGSASGKLSGSESVFATGTFVGPASFGTTTLDGDADYDVFFARYDASGEQEWVKEITGPTSLSLTDSDSDGAGGLVLAGTASEAISVDGQTYSFYNNGFGAWLAHVSPDGQVSDVVIMDSESGWVRINDVTSTKTTAPIPGWSARTSGSNFVAGAFVNDMFILGGPQFRGFPDFEVALFGIVDFDLNFTSLNLSSGPESAAGTAVALGPAGNTYFTGSYEGSTTMFAGQGDSNGGRDVVLLMLRADGGINWVTGFGGTDDDLPSALVVDSRGVAWVSGQTDGTFDFDGAFQVGNSSGSSVFLLGFAGEPTPIYAHTWTGTGLAVTAMDASDEGGICVAGYFETQMTAGGTTLTASSSGNEEAFVAHLSSDGSVNWSTSMGGSGNDRANSVAAVGAGDCIVGGQYEGTADIGGTTYHSVGMTDAFLIRLSGPTTSVAREADPVVPTELELSVFPSPARDQISIRYETKSAGVVRLSLIDLLGREVKIIQEKYEAPGVQEITVNLDGMASGIYLCRVMTERAVRSKPIAIYR